MNFQFVLGLIQSQSKHDRHDRSEANGETTYDENKRESHETLE